MKANKHEINGYIYVTSEELDSLNSINGYKIILTNDKSFKNIQQLSTEEVEYLKSVDSFEVRKEKYSERFENDKSAIGNPDTWGNRYVLVIPQETEQTKESIEEKETQIVYSEDDMIEFGEYIYKHILMVKIKGMKSVLKEFNKHKKQ